MNSNMYQDGTYLRNNPSMHEEDSNYKFRHIRSLLEDLQFDAGALRILDIGGGGGLVGAQVCRYLASRGAQVECHAFDLSTEMLAAQRDNNPYITVSTSDFTELASQGCYDLTLLIDVIEHIPDHHKMADDVSRISEHVLYNIPTERNLLDWLRNLQQASEAQLDVCARLPVSYPLAMSLALSLAHTPLDQALQACAFGWAENMTQAALKSVPLGQSAGQRMLARLAREIPLAVQTAMALPDEDRQAFSPMLAILSSRHETQYSRIFRS